MRDLDWELFDRYLAGAATPAEQDDFERWLAERPEREAMLVAWRRALEALESQAAASDREAVWAGTLEQVGTEAARPPRKVPIQPRPAHPNRPFAGPIRWRVVGGIAAALVLAVGAALARRTFITDEVRTEPAAERVVTVPRGQRVRFRLPDGSQVLLAAGSTLRHPRIFADRFRDVILEGEAYFTVEHDTRRPFRVKAGDLIATDLGTEFLVRAYPEDAQARVVVRSGAVAVRPLGASAAHAELVVRPGELGRLGANGGLQIERVDTAAYFGWTEGTLVFDGTPLRDALPQLSRWYDLEFRLADSSLGNIPLSGRLDQTVTEGRLDLIAGSLGLEQVRRGRVVTLSRR